MMWVCDGCWKEARSQELTEKLVKMATPALLPIAFVGYMMISAGGAKTQAPITIPEPPQVQRTATGAVDCSKTSADEQKDCKELAALDAKVRETEVT